VLGGLQVSVLESEHGTGSLVSFVSAADVH
jgi:hypothetical protein